MDLEEIERKALQRKGTVIDFCGFGIVLTPETLKLAADIKSEKPCIDDNLLIQYATFDCTLFENIYIKTFEDVFEIISEKQKKALKAAAFETFCQLCVQLDLKFAPKYVETASLEYGFAEKIDVLTALMALHKGRILAAAKIFYKELVEYQREYVDDYVQRGRADEVALMVKQILQLRLFRIKKINVDFELLVQNSIVVVLKALNKENEKKNNALLEINNPYTWIITVISNPRTWNEDICEEKPANKKINTIPLLSEEEKDLPVRESNDYYIEENIKLFEVTFEDVKLFEVCEGFIAQLNELISIAKSKADKELLEKIKDGLSNTPNSEIIFINSIKSLSPVVNIERQQLTNGLNRIKRKYQTDIKRIFNN